MIQKLMNALFTIQFTYGRKLAGLKMVIEDEINATFCPGGPLRSLERKRKIIHVR
jgi:hypothetical protein